MKPISCYEKFKIIHALNDSIKFFESVRASDEACNKCEYHSHGYCNFHKEKIPQDILTEGCDNFLFDVIPF